MSYLRITIPAKYGQQSSRRPTILCTLLNKYWLTEKVVTSHYSRCLLMTWQLLDVPLMPYSPHPFQLLFNPVGISQDSHFSSSWYCHHYYLLLLFLNHRNIRSTSHYHLISLDLEVPQDFNSFVNFGTSYLPLCCR